MRGVLKSHGAALIWHVLACIYVFSIVVMAFDAERTRDVALVWVVGGALLAFTPGFRSMRTAGLVLAALLPVGLLAAEVAVRARFLGWRAFAHALDVRPDPGSFSRELRATTKREGSRDEIATLRPEATFWLKGVLVTTNALGYRGTEFAVPKPKNTLRIAVCGDSFTLALGVDAKCSYSELFERELNARGTARHFEVINLAFFGDALSAIQKRFRIDVAGLDADAVVVGLSRRMLAKPVGREGVGKKAPLPQAKFARFLFGPEDASGREAESYSWIARHCFVLYSRPRLEFLRKWLVKTGMKFEPADSEELSIDENEIRPQFAQLGRFSREHGMPIVIVWIRPLRFDREERQNREVGLIRETATAEGLAFVDPSPLFPENAQSLDYVIFPGDRHPNARAHALFAEALVRFAASDSGKMVFEPAQTSPATP